MHLVRFKKYALLLDCGLIQQADFVTSYRLNKEQLKKIKPKEIDYVILSHCHIDHSGMIPSLFAKGCNAHIYVPTGSLPFLGLLWQDSMKIMQSDCLKMQNKHGIKATPFYTQADIDKALMRCIEVDFNKPYSINQDMKFTYYSAGHIINSAQVYLELKEGSVIKRIGFTGDIGGLTPRPYIEPIDYLPYCNLLIGENTYNVPTRPNKTKDRAKDIEKISTIVANSDKVLFPCFALGRCQELLKVLFEMWKSGLIAPDTKIYVDSPLAVKFCNIYSDDIEWQEIIQWKNVKFISEYTESLPLQTSNEKCIIIASSGFLTGGRIMSHLKTALPNPNNHIIFIGFAGENNLASQIKRGQKEVKVDGELVSNKANITSLVSFSSHASYEELIDYYSTVRFDKIALTHGEYSGKLSFTKALQDKLSSQGKSSRVICAAQDQKIYL